MAPLVGLSVGSTIELARGIRVERIDGCGPGARTAPLAFERGAPFRATLTLPDAPGELADAVTALRLATGAAVAAGPLVLEQLDRHPLEPRPLLGIAATVPGGEPSRLDPWRGKLAGDLLGRLPGSEHDGELGEALERWELSLFESEPLRSERLREALAALLGGVGRALGGGDAGGHAGRRDHRAGEPARGSTGCSGWPGASVRMRRPWTPSGGSSSRPFSPTTGPRLLASLDEALLGLRGRPAGFFSARASAA